MAKTPVFPRQGAQVQSLVGGLRSYYATAKTWHSQVNKYFKKYLKLRDVIFLYTPRFMKYDSYSSNLNPTSTLSTLHSLIPATLISQQTRVSLF